jgi:hypothetical protein
MDTLGVQVVSTEVVGGHREGHYIVPGVTQPFEPNLIDYRHSVVQAGKRADAGDETLEICPHCMCEVDVEPQPHEPGCSGIGAPHAASAGTSSTTSKVLARAEAARAEKRPVKPNTTVRDRNVTDRDREALARMDAGEPQEPEPDEKDATLGEEAAVGDLAVSGSARHTREPERAAPSPSVRSLKWTRERIIEAIQYWAAAHDGKPPTRRDWKAVSADRPSDYQVRRVFPSWADAIEAAGFDKPTRGTRRSKHSSREGAASQPEPRGHARPGDGGGRDDEPPAMRAPTPEATDVAGEPEPGPAPDHAETSGAGGPQSVGAGAPSAPEDPPSPIVALLARQRTSLLERMRAEMQAQLDYLQRDLRQVEEALARKTGTS